MGISFLSPHGALLALAVVLPLAAFVSLESRARRVRGSLGVPEPQRSARIPIVLAICCLVGLLALAASQPVLATTKTSYSRTDAEAFFVFDISRSMLASRGRNEPTRFERAKRLASELRRRLPDVPVGIASLTDRPLPHLFPTTDQASFSATLGRAVGIERPPPTGFDIRATTLGALATVATSGFFSRSVPHRLLVVFTDGESRPVFPARFGAVFRRPPAIKPVFVHVWGGQDERIYSTGLAEPGYLPDPTSRTTIARLAAAASGRTFREDELDEVTRAARTFLGRAEARAQAQNREKQALAPYVLTAALLPLSLLLRRRNAGGGSV